MSSHARKARRQRAGAKGGGQQGRLAQAIADHKAGRIEAAEAGYEATLKAQPNSVPALQYLGVIHAGAGNFDRALPLLDKAARIAPTNGEVLSNQAVARRMAGDYAGAYQAARKALQFETDNSSARYTRGVAARALGELADAAASFDTLLAQLGDHTDVLIERAETALAQGDQTTARDVFDRAIDRLLGLAKPLAYYARTAEALIQLNRLDRAKLLLDHALTHQAELPGSADDLAKIWTAMGRLRDAQGLPDAAQAAYEQAQAAEPTDTANAT